jgi:hypothetical protein
VSRGKPLRGHHGFTQVKWLDFAFGRSPRFDLNRPSFGTRVGRSDVVGVHRIGNPGDKEPVASGIAISRCPKRRRGDSDVEESTLTCIGDRRFVILGNHSSGNRETPKHDFPTG